MLRSKRCLGTCSYMGGLPSNLEAFTWSWGQMIAYNSDYVCGPNQSVHYDRTNHSFHLVARNDLVKSMRGDWLLMLDTDHQFEPDILARLLNRMNQLQADVIVGAYQHRSPPFGPTLWMFADDNGTPKQLAAWPEVGVLDEESGYVTEAIQVDVAGAGCLLVRRKVFQRIAEELGEEPFSVREYKGTVGEDFAFFRRLAKLGIVAVCDPRIECHHLYVKPLSIAEDYDRKGVGSVTGVQMTKRVATKKEVSS
jgi:cellulose synthase/poly-beta-1,6-N-acetylglucosamine synthase-like glycosyltransferase